MTQGLRRNPTVLAGGVLLMVVLVAPWVGHEAVSPADVVSSQPSISRHVFWNLRVPRIAMAALAGAALASAGCVFQATFRNPLAEPFTLGVASGAAVGAALAFHRRWTGIWYGMPMVTLCAFVGAAVTVMVVYAIAARQRRVTTETLLLAGIAIGFVCAAAVLLIEYLSLEAVTNQTVRWLMGSVAQVGFDGVLAAMPLVILGGGVVWFLHRDLDLLMMGELVAAGRGVSVGRARAAAYFAASAMTAAIVAQCGPIAFVGLVVPHVVRRLTGPIHATLLPAAMLIGAAFLIVCDTLASNLMHWASESPMQIPVGVVTNLIGGVFFLGMLLRRRGER